MEHINGSNSNVESSANVTFIFAGYTKQMTKFKVQPLPTKVPSATCACCDRSGVYRK
jgi:hypothetical protein